MGRKIIRRGENGTIIKSEDSNMQIEFVKHVADGMEPFEAAKLAGYQQPANAAYRLVRLPHIELAIKKERAYQLHGEVGALGMKRLKTLLRDDETPANVAFHAVKWVMEHCGYGAVNRSKEDNTPLDKKSLSDMTLAELETFVAAGRKAEERLKVIDVTQDQEIEYPEL